MEIADRSLPNRTSLTMTLTITLEPEEESQIRAEAQASGAGIEEMLHQLIRRALNDRKRRRPTAANAVRKRDAAAGPSPKERAIGAGYGMLAGLPGGSYEYDERKQEEIAREEERWRRRHQ